MSVGHFGVQTLVCRCYASIAVAMLVDFCEIVGCSNKGRRDKKTTASCLVRRKKRK